MALESTTFIDGLVPTNPTASDNISQGDDHIRLLKSALKATFPNVSGAVTATHTELNHVDGVTSPLQTQLDAKAPLASPTFTGTVVLPASTSIGTVSSTELGYLDGVTSALQTQLDAKASTISLGSLAALSTVGTSEITNSSVTTAKIADNAVDGTKIALGSDAQGDLMYYDGTNWVRLAAGTSGYFLKTNGASANPAWATVPSVGVGQTWQQPSRSNSTSYQNTTGIPIQVAITGLTGGGVVNVQVSDDNTNWIVVGAFSSNSYASTNFIVPNNGYYRLNGSLSNRTWAELR